MRKVLSLVFLLGGVFQSSLCAQTPVAETAVLTYVPNSSFYFKALTAAANSDPQNDFDLHWNFTGIYGSLAGGGGPSGSFVVQAFTDFVGNGIAMNGFNTGSGVIASYFALPGYAFASTGIGGSNTVSVGLKAGSAITTVGTAIGHGTVSAMTMAAPNSAAFAHGSITLSGPGGTNGTVIGDVMVAFGSTVALDTQIVNGVNVSTTTIIPGITWVTVNPTFLLNVGDEITVLDNCGTAHQLWDDSIIETAGTMCDVYVTVSGT